MDRTDILSIIQKHDKGTGGLIAILEEIQQNYTYLPEAALRLVEKETGRSLVDIYGVATFYKAFSLKPRGKHSVCVCLGTACHVRGAQKIAEEFTHQLGVSPGETTPDKEITFETVNCLGACALGPAVVADGHYFPHVTKNNVSEIITRAREGLEKIDAVTDVRIFPLQVSCPSCNQSLMDPDFLIDEHPSVKFDASVNGTKGWLRLSSLYGSQATAQEHDFPLNHASAFYCPHCLREMPSFSNCMECDSPMAALFVRPGCAWELCTRSGCPGHLLNLEQVNMNGKKDEG